MKLIHSILIVVCLLTWPIQTFSQTLDLMSLNIRYDNPDDGKNTWSKRKSELVKLVDYYHPDFLGTQEGLEHQVKYLDTSLPDYSYIGVGRGDGNTQGEYAAILYDSTKYELVSQNTFWLSDHPDQVSIGWDAAMERICTFGIFKPKASHEKLYVFNAHFDHIGAEARKKSAQLIIKKIGELTNDDSIVVLMGDFNCEANSQPIALFKSKFSDGSESSLSGLYGPLGTFNAFDPQHPVDQRIDYIFTRNLDVLSYRHIDDKRSDLNFISDHLPVLIKAKTD